jgi:hypothetical protein
MVLIVSLLLFGAAAGVLWSMGGESSADESVSSPGAGYQQALAFAQCMRDNGIVNYPDPQQKDGRIQLNGGLNLDSPVAERATQACRSVMPENRGPEGGRIDPARLGTWVQCLRQSGAPAFPDPDVTGDHMTVDLSGAGVNPRSSQFQKAIRACQAHYPGGTLELQGPGGQR